MWLPLSLYFALWIAISLIIFKRLMRTIPPMLFLLLNIVCTAPFMFMLIFFSGGIPHLSHQFYWLTFVSGVLDTVAAICSIMAIKKSPISLISPISSFNPVFTTIIAAFTIGEIPSNVKLLGIIVIVIGSYVLNIKDFKTSIFTPVQKLVRDKGVQLFFAANFIWAVTPIRCFCYDCRYDPSSYLISVWEKQLCANP